MKMNKKWVFPALAFFAAPAIGEEAWSAPGDQASPFEVEIEGGPVWQSRNDVRIPNDASGTKFSLVDALGSGPYAAGRAYITWNASERHSCRILLAPLSITGTCAFEAPVDFAGEFFAAGAPTKATYRFNSWRATYRYRFGSGEGTAWWIGFTAKVRDAKIQLDQEGVTARKTDVGFVPLLNIRGRYRARDRWYFILDIDALAGGPGRAEDVALELRYDAGGRWRLSGGYRTVEGGADVDAVYSFAWLHYMVLSAEMRF